MKLQAKAACKRLKGSKAESSQEAEGGCRHMMKDYIQYTVQSIYSAQQ